MDETFYVAVTAIDHGYLEENEDGVMVNKRLWIEAGTKLSASEIGDEELLNTFIEQGTVAEIKDVVIVENTERVEALESELTEKEARIAELEALLAQATNPTN